MLPTDRFYAVARNIYKTVMKTFTLILALALATALTGLAGGNLQTTNTLRSHKILPVGTSISGLWINTNVVSGRITSPTTNRLGILLPPTGLHVQKG